MSESVTQNLNDMRIIDLTECARVAGVSLSTLRRRIDAGDGPPVIRMSPRRVGVRADDLSRWIEGRRA